MLTRRCTQRQLLLRPSDLTNQTYGYLLAVASRRFGIRVHAFCVMSNHVHLVVTDPEARLPAFQQFLDSLAARALNAALGRWENFWAPSSYSAVALTCAKDVVDKAAYVLANPVLAGLVARGRDWPGLWAAPGHVRAERLVFQRPSHFFREEGTMPAQVTMELSRPPGFESDDAFRSSLELALAAKEGAARDAMAASRGRFLGVRRVLAQPPTVRPSGSEPRRALSPRVACRDKWKRIEVLNRLAAFLRSYRTALLAWRAGKPAVVFPAGTYLVRLTHSVACAAPG